MIKINSLEFSYADAKKIIRGFSDEFKMGERICLRSPSGTGKTTLLKIIAGLLKADKGSVITDKRAKISFCFQEDDLLPWYTALKNASLASDEKSARELLCLFGLSDSLGKYPSELSGGMKKRVSLARALSVKPDILLIDEGFTGIERDLQIKIIDYLKAVSEKSVIVFATHDDFVAEKLSTRTVFLSE